MFQNTTYSLQRMSSSLETDDVMRLDEFDELDTQLSRLQNLRPESLQDMDCLSSCQYYEVQYPSF